MHSAQHLKCHTMIHTCSQAINIGRPKLAPVTYSKHRHLTLLRSNTRQAAAASSELSSDSGQYHDIEDSTRTTNGRRRRGEIINDHVQNDDPKEMYHNVIWNTTDGEQRHRVMEGEILRSAMLKRGVSPHNGRSRLINCRGLGTCGTCAVEIVCETGRCEEDSDGGSGCIIPPERNVKEKLRLNFPPHGGSGDQSPKLRLACQVQVFGDIKVSKRSGFWGQYQDLAGTSDAKLYFGDMEYILDDKSPCNSNDDAV